MVRRVNRGSGNALGIIGIALTATYWRVILLAILLIILPLWLYLSLAVLALMFFIINEFNKYTGEKNEKTNK